MKVVSTKVTNEEWEALVDKCNERGMTIAEYLRDLMQKDSDNVVRTATNREEKSAESVLDRIKRNRSPRGQPGQEPNALSELLRRYR